MGGDTCIPMEGLCYYSISRAGAQVTVQFGCWPSTVHQSRAWLGQPECRHEEGRGAVCLCSSELCNLKIPFPELHKPEGTEVQSLLVLCLLSRALQPKDSFPRASQARGDRGAISSCSLPAVPVRDHDMHRHLLPLQSLQTKNQEVGSISTRN